LTSQGQTLQRQQRQSIEIVVNYCNLYASVTANKKVLLNFFQTCEWTVLTCQHPQPLAVSVDHQQPRFDAEQRRVVSGVGSSRIVGPAAGPAEISTRNVERGVVGVDHRQRFGDDDSSQKEESPAATSPNAAKETAIEAVRLNFLWVSYIFFTLPFYHRTKNNVQNR
jgi:hypothetical protein